LKPEKVPRHVVTSPRAELDVMRIHPRPQFTMIARLVQVGEPEAGEGLRIA